MRIFIVSRPLPLPPCVITLSNRETSVQAQILRLNRDIRRLMVRQQMGTIIRPIPQGAIIQVILIFGDRVIGC
jgi:hypothetical protein